MLFLFCSLAFLSFLQVLYTSETRTAEASRFAENYLAVVGACDIDAMKLLPGLSSTYVQLPLQCSMSTRHHYEPSRGRDPSCLFVALAVQE